MILGLRNKNSKYSGSASNHTHTQKIPEKHILLYRSQGTLMKRKDGKIVKI